MHECFLNMEALAPRLPRAPSRFQSSAVYKQLLARIRRALVPLLPLNHAADAVALNSLCGPIMPLPRPPPQDSLSLRPHSRLPLSDYRQTRIMPSRDPLTSRPCCAGV
mmetsp:Transcript_26363/g.57760  ORF Transcript_26363/g.57760 Transcript_26363/m.57760 type:complete len:108 (-) Transcript_26363:535-858(-)|eukprot:5126555-Pleurochrysis_carterae.AAC.2